jgi:phosphoserine phosphatase RsbU/P
MTQERTARELLPDAVSRVLDEFRRSLALDAHLWVPRAEGGFFHLYPRGQDAPECPSPGSILLEVPTRENGDLTLEVRPSEGNGTEPVANALRASLETLYQYDDEVRYFTREVSERYEEINLLYSISETLGSLMRLEEAARFILTEVCDVVAARRGSLWVHDRHGDNLRLVASVGAGGLQGPLSVRDAVAVTAQVFRDGRPLILSGTGLDQGEEGDGQEGEGPRVIRDDSILSVPIRYTPPSGETRTVGVINLIGHRRGGRFTASDKKLLSAIASQVGAALENRRLVGESLEQERVTREMELAHNLQMKLLPSAESLDPDRVAARVEPTELVGGDFYHFIRLPGGRMGMMIGDVSTHGFPAALIMALSMSAATIYATELQSPAQVLSRMSEALMDELESTEMYLTLFYGVIDPDKGELVFANAGHPHAFLIPAKGEPERLAPMDPPMGIVGRAEYQQRSVPWKAGEDLLFLFTDGLSDDLVPGSRMTGEKTVVAEAARLRKRPVGEIVDALFRLSAPGFPPPEPNGDDRTAVVCRF